MHRLVFALLIVSLIAGCISTPTGPNITALPGKDRSLTEFQRSDVYCRDYESKQVTESPTTATAKSTAQSSLITGALGAAAGAVIGAVTGDPAAGAAIGGASGGVLGAAGGAGAGQRAAQTLQQRYDSAYAQCLYAEGHQIPSMPTMSR